MYSGEIQTHDLCNSRAVSYQLDNQDCPVAWGSSNPMCWQRLPLRWLRAYQPTVEITLASLGALRMQVVETYTLKDFFKYFKKKIPCIFGDTIKHSTESSCFDPGFNLSQIPAALDNWRQLKIVSFWYLEWYLTPVINAGLFIITWVDCNKVRVEQFRPRHNVFDLQSKFNWNGRWHQIEELH